jgi:uncharacterized protein (TIGR04222 family)
MSPFDLPGPLFLVFYLFCGAVALIIMAMLHNFAESRDTTKVNLSDAYLIAYLRGGRKEALRVATVSLIDRGLLKVSGSTISAIASHAASGVRSPLEYQLLRLCQTPREASSVYSEHCFDSDMDRNEAELVQLGLMPTGSVKTERAQRLVLVLAVLWGIAITKIFLALERGHKNIGFLVILAIAFGFGAYKITHPRQTGRGKALLADLGSLFSSLKNRSASFHPGSNPNELALLAAVFGVDAIPKDVFPHARTLYPQISSSSDSGGSCGSSCGGGGCGGGCGGCGS